MTDDFFSNIPARRDARSSPTSTTTHDDFAQAISLRFGSADLRTARLLPGDLPAQHLQPSTHTPAPLHPPPPPRPSPPQSFSALPPSTLATYLADPRTLILDIRPHAAHAAGRIHHALSLSVPTTLLKRPLFSLSKLSQMLPSPSSRARFADWSSASCILVYDSDSLSSPDNSIITGLLRKFRAEGFVGELGWVRGGFQAVWREARDLTTTEQPVQEEDDLDIAASSGTLRTTHLPKAAFSLFSTTAAPLPQLGAIHSYVPNTPAPSASRAANPFFDTIRQNVELSHGITERIPLRLPKRVRRRIHDLPFRWLQDIARRSALRHPSISRHLGLDTFESESESSDDPHTSDPEENDPNVEEGTETLAMQFYRIELAEQRRLRSIMEHHTRESEISAFTSSVKSRRAFAGVGAESVMSVRPGSKSVPSTPHPTPFPFSITAGVEKGTKNRYTHIWPFEHARVRLHDGRHQGSHPGKRDKGKSSERGRGAKDRSGGEGREWEEQEADEKEYKSQSQEVAEGASPSKRSFYSEVQSSITSAGSEAAMLHRAVIPGSSVPRVKIEYDVTDQDTGMSGPPTPVTALPLLTPPFYTPMEIPSAPTPMRAWPPQLLSDVSPGTQFALPASSLPSPGPLSSLSMRLPNRPGGLLPSIGEYGCTSEFVAPGSFASRAGTVAEAVNDTGTKREPRREPSPVDDYVNASYVQPLGTRKRYIATQGPLPSTYVDFWTLVWEQNVHVIVMLTREVENAMVKCGSYWTDAEYGPLRLELISTSPPVSPRANLTAMDISRQGFFAIREPQEKSRTSKDQPTLIVRRFSLSHNSYPGVAPRRITQYQYLDWSDMNVPDDPRGVLDLIQRVEQAVAESTPGPSPCGSGSLSGSPSPDIIVDLKGYDASLLSPTSAGTMLAGGRRRHGNEWRHPELDLKTGIAKFALGKTPPVLLHCSAGVGRTGGFIAVDAVLDGIRRELRKNMEQRRLQKIRAMRNLEENANENDVEASVELSFGGTEAGVNSGGSSREESTTDEHGGRMDVDDPTVDEAGKVQNKIHMMNTVPIHVSAGERTKGGRHRHRGKDLSSKKRSSSSESLVVHVPYAGSDVPEGTNVAGMDLDGSKVAGWQSKPHSTREWVEQVSDQTRAPAGEDRDLQLPPSLDPSGRERSPGSTSNSSSGPSADDSMNGSGIVNVSGSAAGSGAGNIAERKSDTGSASGSGTGSRGPPPSAASKPGSGSMSLSTSGSGADTGSRFGSSLTHAHLRDSSVTSISADSTHSLSLEHKAKTNSPLYRSAVHISVSSNMEVDHPPRPISVPPQPAHSSTMSLQRAVHSRHHKPMLGSSPIASISSPILPFETTQQGVSFSGTSVEGSVLQPSSGIGSDNLASSRELRNGENGGADGRRENNQTAFDRLAEFAPTKPGSNLRVNTALGSLKVQEDNGISATNPSLPKGKEWGIIQQLSRTPHDSALPQSPSALLGASEHDQRTVDHPVIDYKLPRELHIDLSPPLISSFAEPICMVIQDMREQRMSLCQSLRQYVFVHAAIIEGALRIVDEEREFWGYGETSEETSSAEGEGSSVRRGVQRTSHRNGGPKDRFGRMNKAEIVVRTRDLDYGYDTTPHGTRPLTTTAQPSNQWGSEDNNGGIPVQTTSAPSSAGVPSPSKGKRGPSPTELLREDRTGALSSNKRPSIHRKTRSDKGAQFSFGSSKPPPASKNGGGSIDAPVGMSGTRAMLGRPVVPEKGGPTA